MYLLDVLSREQWRALCAASLLVLSVCAGGAVGTTGPAPTSSANNTTNTTPQSPHLDPSTIQAEGNPDIVADRLVGQLQGRLAQSATSLSNEEFELAQAAIAEGYGRNLSRYASLAAEVDEEAVVEQLNLTREQQASLIESVREAETIGRAYRQAVENGNDEEARELARELLVTAEEVNQTTGDLNQQYAALSNQTGVSFDEVQQALRQVQLTTQEANRQLRQRESTDTRLNATVNRTQFSTTTPVQVTGTLRTVNGTPVDNASIRLRFGGETIETRTTSRGTFNITYRPIQASLTASTLRVSYTPAPDRLLLASETQFNVSITEQTPVPLVLTNATETAQFDAPVAATGRIGRDSVEPARFSGLPLTLSVDGTPLTQTEIGPDGEVALQAQLPADIPAGDQTLRITSPQQELAIAPTAVQRPIFVQQTPTTVSATTTLNEEATNLTVTGQLETSQGDALSDRPISIAIDDQEITTAETVENGTYSVQVPVEPPPRGGDRLVSVRFEGTASNLAASSTQQSVVFPGILALISFGRPAMILIALLALGGLGLVARQWSQTDRGESAITSGSSDTPDTAHGSSSTESCTGDNSGMSFPATLLSQARSVLSRGLSKTAITIAYGVVRQKLMRRSAVDTSKTHREFYDQWRANEEADTARLHSLTMAYERAVFTPEAVSETAASKAIAEAEASVSDTQDTSTQRPADTAESPGK